MSTICFGYNLPDINTQHEHHLLRYRIPTVWALLTCPWAALTKCRSPVGITETALKLVPTLFWRGIIKQVKGPLLGCQGCVPPPQRLRVGFMAVPGQLWARGVGNVWLESDRQSWEHRGCRSSSCNSMLKKG